MVDLNAQLRRDIRQLLAEMETVSEADGVSYIPTGTRPAHDSRALTSTGKSLHDTWADRFAAHTDDPAASRRLLKAGETALDIYRRGRPHLADQADTEDFILTAYEGVTPDDVAAIETERGTLCRPAYVRWLRRVNEREEHTGYPAVPRPGKLAYARSRQAEGATQAQIAKELGVHRSTVSRMLQDERAA